MFEEPVSLSVEQIQQDLSAVASWDAREQALLAPYRSRVRERGSLPSPSPSGEQGGVGRHLLRRCGADAEQRLSTLLHLESSLEPGHDHGVLIGWGSQLVESVLVRLVAEQLRPSAHRLVEALGRHAKDADAAESLALWGQGRLKTTLGIMVNLLLAMRRAEELDLADVRELISRLEGRDVGRLR
jgi:hypothetical protein